MATRYQVRVETANHQWAGHLYRGNDAPACDGSLNQTNMTAEEASTFDTRGAAEDFMMIARAELREGTSDRMFIVEVDA